MMRSLRAASLFTAQTLAEVSDQENHAGCGSGRRLGQPQSGLRDLQ